MTTKSISIGLYLHPLQYFLLQPPNKSLKYAAELKFAEVIPKSLYELYISISNHLIYFNYFKFEDEKYIHGLNCTYIYNAPNLRGAVVSWLYDYIKEREYEMAREIILNVLGIEKFFKLTNDYRLMFNVFLYIVYYFMDRNPAELILQNWEEVENAISKSELLDVKVTFYMIYSAFFENLNFYDLANYCYKKVEIFKSGDKHEKIKYIRKLGFSYYENGNYKAAKTNFKKSIKFYSKFSDDNSFNFLMELYLGLFRIYEQCGQKKKLNKIIRIIEKMQPSDRNKPIYDLFMGIFYFITNNFDKSIAAFWSSIKECKKKGKLNYQHQMLDLYLYLGRAYFMKDDWVKAHQMYANAKSCYGILSIGNDQIKKVYLELGMFYTNSSRYKEALEYFEELKKYYSGYTLCVIKWTMGTCYFYLRNYDKALEIFNEVKKVLYALTEVPKTLLFNINVDLGRTYEILDNIEQADYFYMEAFKLIPFYRHEKMDFYLYSPKTLFEYFERKSDYEKCEYIIQKSLDIIKNNFFLECKLNDFYILKTRLCIYQGNQKEAEKYLNKVEKNLKIEELWTYPQKKLSEYEINLYLKISYIYVKLKFSESETNLLKTEKLLKSCERFKDEMKCDGEKWVDELYDLLGDLYLRDRNWDKSNYILKISIVDLINMINSKKSIDQVEEEYNNA